VDWWYVLFVCFVLVIITVDENNPLTPTVAVWVQL